MQPQKANNTKDFTHKKNTKKHIVIIGMVAAIFVALSISLFIVNPFNQNKEFYTLFVPSKPVNFTALSKFLNSSLTLKSLNVTYIGNIILSNGKVKQNLPLYINIEGQGTASRTIIHLNNTPYLGNLIFLAIENKSKVNLCVNSKYSSGYSCTNISANVSQLPKINFNLISFSFGNLSVILPSYPNAQSNLHFKIPVIANVSEIAVNKAPCLLIQGYSILNSSILNFTTCISSDFYLPLFMKIRFKGLNLILNQTNMSSNVPSNFTMLPNNVSFE
ncbi:MAG: hypothetical protein QXD11_00590 [Candidatus Micrarchaeaceae archaeon]